MDYFYPTIGFLAYSLETLGVLVIMWGVVYTLRNTLHFTRCQIHQHPPSSGLKAE